MVFGPFADAWKWIKSHNPGNPFKKRHWNFLTIHYVYMLGLIILTSVIIYPGGGIKYIDALFFTAGATTQSGLNTVDFNKLFTYQQVTIYFIAMIANPIFINTFVVFVRLYWFEKRFENIVQEARNFRKSKSRSRYGNTQGRDDNEKDPGAEERGVNGRSIVVLHNNPNVNKTAIGKAISPFPPFEARKPNPLPTPDSSSASSDALQIDTESRDMAGPDTSPHPHPQPSFHRDIVFADEVNQSLAVSPLERLRPSNAEQHIAFLENQRNPKDKDILRIPGPQKWDRGDGPEKIEDSVASPDEQVASPFFESRPFNSLVPRATFDENRAKRDHPLNQSITVDDPHRWKRDISSPFSKLSFRKFHSEHGHKHEPNPFDKEHSINPPRSRSSTFGSLRPSSSREKQPMPYLSWQPTIGRNSAFVDLTEEQREELGGIEYRSLKTLVIILVSYFVLFHALGAVMLVPWIKRTEPWGGIVDADGQNRVWWGIFTSATMFNDLGFTLTPDSMVSFQLAVLPLLLGSFLIVIGNTGFPCMLRLLIWTCSKLVPRDSGIWEELRFLLDHPRRCFTLLFPGQATWWLFWILVLFNGIDLIFFIILDLNDAAVTSINPVGYRVLDGLFQAFSTRTAGTSVVNLADLHPGIQVSYLIMMYISVFPIAISVRRTNVYEEKSLGIYGSHGDEDDEDEQRPSYVGAHLRKQLSFDLWFIFMGLFVIAIAEGPRLQDATQTAFTLFAVLFEIVSAYGTVGLSLGYTGINASFSAEFSVISKLVIIAMMIRGRHRGLPYDLDRAILLPSESLHKKEDQDAAKRVRRGSGGGSSMVPLGAVVTQGTNRGNLVGRSSRDTGGRGGGGVHENGDVGEGREGKGKSRGGVGGLGAGRKASKGVGWVMAEMARKKPWRRKREEDEE